jgi:hypothetical protein
MAAQQNEGEGNKTAARTFNKEQSQFAQSGKVKPAAEDAERAVEGPEGAALRKAEEAGKSRAHEEDPAVNRK